MKRFLVLVLLTLVGASGAVGEDSTGTINNPYQFDDSVVVSANRKPGLISKTGSSVTVVSSEQISKSQAMQVIDLLGTIPGVDVVRSGGMGQTTSLFLRGASSRHTLVLIDGVNVNNPSSGSFDFGHLNLSNVERIEIVRGPQSVLYGSDAIGGLVQIFTKRGYGSPKITLRARGGSFGTYSEAISLSGSLPRLSYSFGLSRLDSDGFSATEREGEPGEKDAYSITSLSGRLGLLLGSKFNLSGSFRMDDSEVDIDKSFGVFDDSNAVVDNRNISGTVRFEMKEAEALWQPSLAFKFMKNEYNSVDGHDPVHSVDSSDYLTEGKRFEVVTEHHLNISDRLNLSFGGEINWEYFESNSYSEYIGWQDTIVHAYDTIHEQSSKTVSIYELNEFRLTENLHSTIGVRYSDHDAFGDILTYRLTALYDMPEATSKFRVTYGSGFKAPTLYELNHPTYGNPELSPEESKGWEVGFEKSIESVGLTLGMLVFKNSYDSLIGYDPLTFVSINIENAESKGHELSLSLKREKYSLSADYTYTDSHGSKPILRRPKHKLGFNLLAAPHEKIDLMFSVRHTGDRDDFDFIPFPAEAVELEAYTTAKAGLTYKINNQFRVQGLIDNILDEKYNEVLYYKSAPRSISVGFEYTL